MRAIESYILNGEIQGYHGSLCIIGDKSELNPNHPSVSPTKGRGLMITNRPGEIKNIHLHHVTARGRLLNIFDIGVYGLISAEYPNDTLGDAIDKVVETHNIDIVRTCEWGGVIKNLEIITSIEYLGRVDSLDLEKIMGNTK